MLFPFSKVSKESFWITLRRIKKVRYATFYGLSLLKNTLNASNYLWKQLHLSFIFFLQAIGSIATCFGSVMKVPSSIFNYILFYFLFQITNQTFSTNKTLKIPKFIQATSIFSMVIFVTLIFFLVSYMFKHINLKRW